jgi:hypothetical protein
VVQFCTIEPDTEHSHHWCGVPLPIEHSPGIAKPRFFAGAFIINKLSVGH